MITIGAALKAHFASDALSTATIWKVTLVNGTVAGFTNHDEDISYDDGGGLVTYVSAQGFSRTDLQTAAALEVDSTEVSGMLVSPAITEDDLIAGLWDFAAVVISLVNHRDLSQGRMVYRTGTLGEVTLDRGSFKTELRGLSQAYTRTVGQLTSPACRTTLGSSLCKVNLTPFTVTGTLTGVNPNNQTVYDTSRTEPGPTAGPSITGITRANPGRVTLSASLGLPNGSPIVISGVLGMLQVNTTTTASNIASDGKSFDLPVDTSSFPSYTGGGTVTPLGADSGYFDNGVFTWTSGPNNGFSIEVHSYVPGQITFVLPIGFPSIGKAAPQVGDTYSLHAGCDYSMATCRDRFNNIVNFRGEPYLPGTDKLMQVGKSVS